VINWRDTRTGVGSRCTFPAVCAGGGEDAEHAASSRSALTGIDLDSIFFEIRSSRLREVALWKQRGSITKELLFSFVSGSARPRNCIGYAMWIIENPTHVENRSTELEAFDARRR
jgi:hypothetical protein